MKREEPKPKGTNAALTAIGVTVTIGTELAVTTVLGFYLGSLLDERLATAPLFLVIGVLLGVAVGILGIVKTLQRFFEF